MKKAITRAAMAVIFLTATAMQASAQNPIALVIQQAIKKVIVAVDLKIQRLQTKTIWLQNAQKVVENEMAKLKLDQITGWVQKQKDLYRDYFDELWKVKDVLVYYHKVKDITTQQIALVNEYKKAWNGVRQDGHFSPEEIKYIGEVYTGIIEESLRSLERVGLVINSFQTQMTDAARMAIINAAADGLQEAYTDLKGFNARNIQLSLQRSKDARDIATVKALYGIQ